MSSKILTDLPDHCLLMISKFCDIRALATLSTVNTKLRVFIREMIFRKKNNFSLASANEADIVDDLIAVSRLIITYNPTNFLVKIERNLQVAKDLPLISVYMNGSATTEVFVESHFLESLHGLDNICKRVQSIHIHIPIYDCHNNDGVNMNKFTAWSKLKKLTISGFDYHHQRVHHFIDFPINAWNLEMILFQNMCISSTFIHDALHTSNQLKNILFENCKFTFLRDIDVIAIAESVRDKGGHFPLGLTFVNVQMKGDALLEAMSNDDVKKYIYIQFWNKLSSVV